MSIRAAIVLGLLCPLVVWAFCATLMFISELC